MAAIMRLTRFALLAALAPIALGIPSLAQRFYPLGSAQVIIDTDGSVLVAGVDPQTTRDVQLALGTSGVEIGASPATVLVDRDGIDWTWEQDRIVGRRLGDVVHARGLKH